MRSNGAETRSLANFFHPRIVAHVGASETGLYPSELFANLASWNGGVVYPVNRRRKTVMGRPAYPTVTSLPRRPDLALITVPREVVGAVVEQCVDAGIPAALIISAGFAESDERGRELQAELACLTDRIRIIGPNCAGLASVTKGFYATRPSGEPVGGSVSFVSSSGAIMMALSGVFSDARLGLRYIASVGNQIDVTLEEIIDFYVEDSETRVIAAFIEGIGSSARFVAALDRARRRGKPVILVKSGVSELGSRVAATHTSALASDGRAFAHVCEQYGAVVVASIAEMVDIVSLASRVPVLPGPRLGVVSQSGGMASHIADAVAADRHLRLPELESRTDAALHALPGVPDYAVLTNPIDVRGGAARGDDIEKTLTAAATQDSFDALFVLFSKNPYREIERETASAIVRFCSHASVPVIVVWLGGGEAGSSSAVSAIRLLRDGNVPVYTDATTAVRSYGALVRRSEYIHRGRPS